MRFLRWLAPLGWMAVIFYFSGQTGSESAGLSGWIVEHMAGLLPLEPETLSLFVRKGAHLTEYAVLGGLLAWARRIRGLRDTLVPVAIGVLFAISDEVHQTFVPGRAGQVTDVLIDSAGVAIGVILMVFIASRHYIGEHVRHDGADHGRRSPVRQEQ